MQKIELFGSCTDEWNDMPEFIQEEQKEYKKLLIRFETEEDYRAFEKLIQQPLTMRTKSIWYPQLQRGKNSSKRYI